MPQATRTHKQEIKGNNKLEFEFSSKLEFSKEPFTMFKNTFQEHISFSTAFLHQINTFI